MWNPTPIAPGPLWHPTTGPTTVRDGLAGDQRAHPFDELGGDPGAVGMGDDHLGATPGLGGPLALLDDPVDGARVGAHPSHRPR